MVWTDPPYGVNYANSAKDKLRGKHRPILNDNLGEAFGDFLLAACREMLAVTKGALYIAMSSSELDTLPFAPPGVTGRPSSSGRNTPSRSGGRTTSASTSPSSTAGRTDRNATGAARGTRGTCGSSRNRRAMICIRP
jgi:hypothetical protein